MKESDPGEINFDGGICYRLAKVSTEVMRGQFRCRKKRNATFPAEGSEC